MRESRNALLFKKKIVWMTLKLDKKLKKNNSGRWLPMDTKEKAQENFNEHTAKRNAK